MNKAILSLAIGGFGIGIAEFVIMGILPNVSAALGVSIPEAGHFIAAYALGVVVGAPLLTGVLSKLPAHKVLLYLMLWFTVFNSLSAVANSYTSLLIFRFLSGLPHGAFFGIGAVVASQLAEKGKAAKAVATMFTGLTLANVIGVPLGTYLGQTLSWNVAFILVGFIGVIAVAGIKWWMPVLKRTSSGSIMHDLRVLRRLELWMVILLTTIGTGGFFAWYSYIAPLLTDVARFSPEMVGPIMIIAGIGMTVGNLLGGKLAQRFVPINAVIITLIAMSIALVVNAFVAHSQIAILIMTFIIGALSFCVTTPIQMTIMNSSKGAEAIGSAMNQSAFNMGNAIGAYLAGLPIAMGFGLISTNLVGAILACLGIGIAVVVIQIRKRNNLNSIQE